MLIYLIGSLRNPEVPRVAAQVRTAGFQVFDDWYAAGEHADDAWRDYEKARGHALPEALRGEAARHVFAFDKHWLETCDAVVLMSPAGKSGHLELGWALGQGTPGYVLLDADPERYDVMYSFATGVASTVDELLRMLRGEDMQRACERRRVAISV